MTPDEGSIEVDGTELVGLPEPELNEVRKKFGFLFQGSALFDSMTVAENVGLPLREHQRLGAEEVRERVRERLDWVGLKGVESMKPASLSGGMRKRVGLARAIAMDPEFVLYDEPTTGLDPIMADVIDQLIRSLQSRLGVTSIIVTHDLASAFKVGDRFAMLHDGKVLFTGTSDEVRNTTQPLVRQFIEGTSQGPIQPVYRRETNEPSSRNPSGHHRDRRAGRPAVGRHVAQGAPARAQGARVEGELRADGRPVVERRGAGERHSKGLGGLRRARR
jgi:phospholipid/cholesterol/gamma-HCH transport system ATP-binding protein